MRSAMLQEHLSHLIMPLLGGNVQGGVLVLCGGICAGAMLQQQHHIVYVAQARCNVERCLLLLFTKAVT